ncbi:GerAB/ArcD/ProY family transporter [Brevibacillus migulae]|uniref:GerAB/ArcD/ProY family transporter n=1 Tax=Brevibacillus migulae TaxID=1644114 RepID=UPI00106E3B83|nr:GerAB/ArcD/ProY family transporter [Brevibacillus migulae]
MDKGLIEKLNTFHVIFLVQNVIIGMNLLTLPHDMSAMGYNQWWILFIIGVLAQLTLIPMYLLGIRYPNQNLYTINEILLGKWLGKLSNLVLLVYSLLTIATVSEVYIRLVQTVTLPERTVRVPLFLLVCVALYIAHGGIKAVARFCILGFFATIWLVYYLQWGLQKGIFVHIYPLLNLSMFEVLDGLREGSPAVLGYELMLLYFPYIQHQKKALRHASIGLWISVATYVAVSFTSVVYFSEWQMEHLMYPVLNLFKAVELSFLERIENFGIAIWIFLILTTISAYLWAAKISLDSILEKRRAIYFVLVGLVVSYPWRGVISLKLQAFLFEHLVIYLGYLMVLWPNLLLVIHWIRKRLGGINP